MIVHVSIMGEISECMNEAIKKIREKFLAMHIMK